MTDNSLISRYFQRFRNIDPRLYDQLTTLVEERVMQVTVAVTVASPDQILVAQGMAREARKWLQLMTEFPPEPKSDGQQSLSADGPVIPTPRGP